MSVAILTKYSGPTNTRGSRIIASMKDRGSQGTIRLEVGYDSALGAFENHVCAAVQLLEREYAQGGELVSAYMPDKTGNVVHIWSKK